VVAFNLNCLIEDTSSLNWIIVDGRVVCRADFFVYWCRGLLHDQLQSLSRDSSKKHLSLCRFHRSESTSFLYSM